VTSTDEDENQENSTPSQLGQVVMEFLPLMYACGRAGYDGGAHEMPKGSPGTAP